MGKVVVVRKVEDLEKLRNYKDVERLTVFVLENIYFEDGYYFLPINLPETDVIIYGLNNSINNLNVNNVKVNNSGLFGSVRNLYVKNLKFRDAKIKGNEVCGILAGHVEFDLNVDGLEVEGFVNSDAISGGLIGTGHGIKVSKSIICPTITGRGCLGGVAGMADTCDVDSTVVSATFKPTRIYRNQNNLIDQYVGYLGSRENARVEALTKEVNEYVEQKQAIKELSL